MTRKVISPDVSENGLYTEVITGGPKKYYRRKRIRKPFVKLPNIQFEPISADWFKVIVKEIAAKRRLQKMTQTTLAQKVGTGQADISRLENGKNNPTIERLERIFQILGLSMKVTIFRVSRDKQLTKEK